jgi:hypothetical protein
MRLGHVRFGALLGIVLLATPVHAAPGDYRLVTGTLIWPHVLKFERLAVVHGDDGLTWFAELASPLGQPTVRFGDRVAVAGREGSQRGQLTSAGITPAEGEMPRFGARPAVPSPLSAVVPMMDGTEAIFGTVEILDGDALTITAGGRPVTVDVAALDAGVKAALARDRQVRVLAQPVEGRLVARGIVVEHGP